LRVVGRQFLYPDGSNFDWRGITAFSLVEQLARGRDIDVDAYLGWCAANGVSLVRVLAMCATWLTLTPKEGLTFLPRLLLMAEQYGLYVEVVGLAATSSYAVDVNKHLSDVAAVCKDHANAVLEGANEPYHSTQQGTVEATVDAFAPPAPVVYCPGAGRTDEGTLSHTGGHFLNVHNDRKAGENGWRWSRHVKDSGDASRHYKMPLNADEAMGAGEQDTSSRDSNPAHFLAFAANCKINSIGSTFHYSDGLLTTIPTGKQLECFHAWRQGLDVVPSGGQFQNSGWNTGPVDSADWTHVLRIYHSLFGNRGYSLFIGLTGPPNPVWINGWHPVKLLASLPGVEVHEIGK